MDDQITLQSNYFTIKLLYNQITLQSNYFTIKLLYNQSYILYE